VISQGKKRRYSRPHVAIALAEAQATLRLFNDEKSQKKLFICGITWLKWYRNKGQFPTKLLLVSLLKF